MILHQRERTIHGVQSMSGISGDADALRCLHVGILADPVVELLVRTHVTTILVLRAVLLIHASAVLLQDGQAVTSELRTPFTWILHWPDDSMVFAMTQGVARFRGKVAIVMRVVLLGAVLLVPDHLGVVAHEAVLPAVRGAVAVMTDFGNHLAVLLLTAMPHHTCHDLVVALGIVAFERQAAVHAPAMTDIHAWSVRIRLVVLAVMVILFPFEIGAIVHKLLRIH